MEKDSMALESRQKSARGEMPSQLKKGNTELKSKVGKE